MTPKIKIYWTQFSLKCLDGIFAYIELETNSRQVANKYINKLLRRVEILENFPEAGQKEELLKHLKQNSRYLIEGSYKIIYQYNGERVIITDVFHVKQNPLKIIKRNKGK